MFLDEDSLRQRLHRVIVQDRDDGLEHDRSAIHVLGHQVNRRAGEPYAVLQRLSLRIKTWKRWQQ
jgi:hypothetical protein